jgi:CHAT domain-containing protein
LIEQHRSTINVEASKIGFVGDKQAVYQSLIKSLYNDEQYEKAFEYVERSKSRALVDVLAGKQNFAVKIAGKEDHLRSIIALSDRVEAETTASDNPENRSQTRGIAIQAKRDLRREAPELASLVTVNPIPMAEIQSLIPKGEALVEYYYAGKDIYVFVLTASGLQRARISSEGLYKEVADFRKSLETPGSKQTKRLGRRLYQRLFKPLEDSLKDRNLIIVPHGILHYIPMNALHNGKDYMIDRFNIRLMPSASAMKYLQQKSNDKKGGILAFGNPDLGDPAYDLAFAQKEALEVTKTWPKSKVFLRKDATEETLNRYRGNYNYIHFATHGEFSSDHPLQSAILLAPDANSNGLLTVDKLYSMQLNADLVTLSACETGLSKVANGDDLVGLTRGFLYAGSNSIVASLWQVDDLSTSYLMIRFYKHLKKNDKRTALRKAQLETRKKYPHPYFWAPFQLTGSGL